MHLYSPPTLDLEGINILAGSKEIAWGSLVSAHYTQTSENVTTSRGGKLGQKCKLKRVDFGCVT